MIDTTKPYVKVTFHKGGKSTTEAVNYRGDACKADTAPFERALGKVLNDTPKAEMFEPAEAQKDALRQ